MSRKMAQPRYYEVTDLKKVVCTTQRAGSNSIAEALRPMFADSAVGERTVKHMLCHCSPSYARRAIK